MNAEFDSTYPAATEPFKSELKHFRQTHPLKRMDVKGKRWTYSTGGRGNQVILVLHGGGPAESLFRYLLRFEEKYLVLAPTVPATVDSVAEVIEAIIEILSQEKITRVHLFGVSNGGMIGQGLVRQYPHTVLSLILFHSMLPSQDYAKVFGRRVKLFSLLPRWVTIALGQKWMIEQIRAEEAHAEPGEVDFWIAYFKELYHSELVTKEYLVARAKILTDYFQNYHFTPNDLLDWGGRVFIIESEHDQVVNGHERERLKRFYNQAKVHTFMGSGHLGGGLFETEETVMMVDEFISQT